MEHFGSVLLNGGEHFHTDYERKFVTNVIIDRLCDDSPDVIKATLNLGSEVRRETHIKHLLLVAVVAALCR